MSENCIFCKIATKEIPSEFIYETENVFAIKDIHPKAKHHFLVIPKKHYVNLSDLDDMALMSELLDVVRKVTQKFELENNFKVLVNNGKNAGQEVFHLHIHVLSNN